MSNEIPEDFREIQEVLDLASTQADPDQFMDNLREWKAVELSEDPDYQFYDDAEVEHEWGL